MNAVFDTRAWTVGILPEFGGRALTSLGHHALVLPAAGGLAGADQEDQGQPRLDHPAVAPVLPAAAPHRGFKFSTDPSWTPRSAMWRACTWTFPRTPSCSASTRSPSARPGPGTQPADPAGSFTCVKELNEILGKIERAKTKQSALQTTSGCALQPQTVINVARGRSQVGVIAEIPRLLGFTWVTSEYDLLYRSTMNSSHDSYTSAESVKTRWLHHLITSCLASKTLFSTCSRPFLKPIQPLKAA